ncbi:Uncharacterised protein [Klebsiella michiganensis]|uniref:Uncharacterized protein n=1 Tax=Klebsiella michiganensis TaxID=1134687 RepID=A0A7H4PN97_9ENTR|nr:Uncharacterised protein [Klebsiella michiganensis]
MSKLLATAVPHAEALNSTADSIKGSLRPSLSAHHPEINAPKTQPTSAELIAQPD